MIIIQVPFFTFLRWPSLARARSDATGVTSEGRFAPPNRRAGPPRAVNQNPRRAGLPSEWAAAVAAAVHLFLGNFSFLRREIRVIL